MVWNNICKPKSCGGLGLRSISAMNSAMLGKIGWSLVSEPDKLWVKTLKAKYFSFSTYMHCRKKKSLFSALACSPQYSQHVDKRFML